MTILVTGGAGYIGSHTCVALLNAGYDIAVLDNFSNSHPASLQRVSELTGRKFPSYDIDLLDKPGVEKVFAECKIEAIVHFAGLKAVSESISLPLRYYQNNITGTLVLCEMMKKYDVRRMVFSSSATVYGNQERVPLAEDSPIHATNPYGRTKMMLEMMLTDFVRANPLWSISLLRYFNPVGAHESGNIGEDANGIPNNLFPYLSQVAIGKRERLTIHGNDYPTKDSTCIRDYIHIMDLAAGHVKALDYTIGRTGAEAFNLGTGHGYSVLEVKAMFEKVSGVKIPFQFGPRRTGDVPISFADASKAHAVFGWQAERTLEQMCADAWQWQVKNPDGYGSLVVS